jgi:flagellin
MPGGIGINPRFDVSALGALRQHRLHRAALADSLAKLASGSRFTSARFLEPAHLVASESLKATLAALDAESRTNERALAVTSMADGALGEVSDLLVEAKSLVIANADGTLSVDQKQANQIQIDAILSSVDRISDSTSFLGTKLLDGNFSIAASGAKLDVDSVHTSNLGNVEIENTDHSLADLKTGGALTTDGEKATQVLDAAIKDVATNRGRIGAYAKHHLQSRLNSLGKAYEELSKANSMIAEVDYAAEVSRKVREELLSRAALFTLKASDRSRRSYAFHLLK